MSALADVLVPRASCRLEDRPAARTDLLAVYEWADALEAALRCPVCDTPYEGRQRLGRVIQFLTGPDEHDTYACPGCRPDEFLRDAERHGDEPRFAQAVLTRAARDVAAGRRLP